MNDDLAEAPPSSDQEGDLDVQSDAGSDEIAKLRGEFHARLIVANLRTEAVRAGMIDLDGLKMVDLSSVRLGTGDRIIGGRKLMDDLRRTSSSSAAVAPVSQPVRTKTALEMTDDEYAAARAAVTKYQY
jgi:hypothetical protein